MAQIIDDKSKVCLDFILEQLIRRSKSPDNDSDTPPFFVGLNGVQGCGKTTLVSTLAQNLSQSPHSLPTVVLSIDDLYLPRQEQTALAAKHPDNPLIQHRGQPSTHDLRLGLFLFSELREGRPTKMPAYDKSAFNGLGDRKPEDAWQAINQSGQPATKVVILEGWCVGFRPLDDLELRRKWGAAVQLKERGGYEGRLGWTKFEDVEFVNNALKKYDPLTDQLDALIHIDAKDPMYVYPWRLEQEAHLRKSKGSGMTDAQVVEFVNGYYPAYELFTDKLRAESFDGDHKRQLRLVIRRDRRVEQVLQI